MNMKSFKKILCTLLVVVMCLTSAPLQGFVGMEWPSLPEINFGEFELPTIDFSSWFGSLAKATTITDQCGDNAYYTYNTETQELVVSGSGAIWDYEMGESPASNVDIKSVVIEEGITYIGEYAFYNCDELINVDIREGLTEVGYGAFMNCKNLTDIIAPASIATVGEAAFYGCENLKNLYFCGTVEQSQNVYFNAYNNELLNSYIHFNYYDYTHISTSQTIKEASCFEEGKVIYMCQCGGVYYITLPETNHTDKDNNACCDVCSLEASSNGYCGESVFWNIYDETQLVISGSGEINNFSENNSPFYNSNIKNVIIENGITSIGIGAFSCCSKLTSIILPDSVTMIGDGAFGGCSNLVSITIPNSVTIIGADAFAGCSNLTSLSLPKNINCIEEFAFANCVSLADIIIPDSVKIIETCAFGGCSNLVNITIPNSVEIIGYCAFVGCTSLTNIIIPDSVTMIEDQAFEGCDNLINVSFVGDGLVDLDGRVFDNCINLSSVYIGESKPKISAGNFLGCNNLNRFIVTETNAEYSTDDKGVLFDKNKKIL